MDEMRGEEGKELEITHKMIEKMKKVVSSHRASLDFDRGYMNKIVAEDGFDWVSEVKSEKRVIGNGKRKRKDIRDMIAEMNAAKENR